MRTLADGRLDLNIDGADTEASVDIGLTLARRDRYFCCSLSTLEFPLRVDVSDVDHFSRPVKG